MSGQLSCRGGTGGLGPAHACCVPIRTGTETCGCLCACRARGCVRVRSVLALFFEVSRGRTVGRVGPPFARAPPFACVAKLAAVRRWWGRTCVRLCAQSRTQCAQRQAQCAQREAHCAPKKAHCAPQKAHCAPQRPILRLNR